MNVCSTYARDRLIPCRYFERLRVEVSLQTQTSNEPTCPLMVVLDSIVNPCIFGKGVVRGIGLGLRHPRIAPMFHASVRGYSLL